MPVNYEWDRETVDEHGDIIDHNHANKLKDIINDDGVLVLVRDVYTEANGVECRSWAYVDENNFLPEFFTDAFDKPVAKVPQRFDKELRNALIERNAQRRVNLTRR